MSKLLRREWIKRTSVALLSCATLLSVGLCALSASWCLTWRNNERGLVSVYYGQVFAIVRWRPALTPEMRFGDGFQVQYISARVDWPVPMTRYADGIARVSVPLWLTSVVAGVLLAYSLLPRRRVRRPLECRYCGYDLSGAVRPRCQECGMETQCDAEHRIEMAPSASTTLPEGKG